MKAILKAVLPLFVLFFSAKIVLAYEYTADVSLSLSEEYNDNIFLTRDRVSDFITFITPGIGLSARSATSELRLGYSPTFSIYSSYEELNDIAHSLTASGNFTLSERLSLALSDTFVKSSEIMDIRAIQNIGPITEKLELISNTVSGNISYRLKTNLFYTLGASYSYTDYKGIDFFKVKTYSGNMGLTYRRSEKTTLTANASYIKYDYRPGSDATEQDYILGVTYMLTPTLSAGLTGGVVITKIEDTGESDTGFSGGVNLTKRFERGTATLSYRQGVIAGIQTISPTRDQTVSLSLSRDITNKLAASMSTSYSKFESVETDVVDTDVTSFNTNLTYTLTPWASLALSYSYVNNNDKISDIGDYYNHIVFLNLRLSYSRRL